MRTVGGAPSIPAGATGFSVTPTAGASFAINTARQTASSANALETFVNQFSAQGCLGAVITGTAAAANKAVAELNNPAASARTLFVYSIDVFVPVAMAIQVVLDGTTLVPAGVAINLFAGGVSGVALVGGGNQLATTGNLIYTTPSLAANSDYAIPQPWVCAIPQGHNLQLIGQTVNQAFTCNIRFFQLNG